MLLSVNQISELTGRDRHGIPKRLENLPFTPGDKGAHLYESREALPLIYAVDNLEAARAAQARSQASLTLGGAICSHSRSVAYIRAVLQQNFVRP